MGIDVYLTWPDQTEKEKKAQFTGFSVVSGSVGYLREAYHGGPYATRVLAPEAFASDNGVAVIKAAAMRDRLDSTIAAAKERSMSVYGEEASDAILQSFRDFVALAERMESEHGSVSVVASY